MFPVEQSLSLPDLHVEQTVCEGLLPAMLAQFHTPPLMDRPQDPIMDFLHLAPPTKHPTLVSVTALAEENPSKPAAPTDDDTARLWHEASKSRVASRSHISSWDALRLSFDTRASRSPFLSDQTSSVLASARYLVKPQIQSTGVATTYVTQDQLLNSLNMTTLATSSELFTWDPDSERFIEKGGKEMQIVVGGLDEVVSGSFMRRFLTIGTLMRRLEVFVSTLRSRHARKHARKDATIHALTHALASILAHLRGELAQASPPTSATIKLNSIWVNYSKFEGALVALAVFCGREIEKAPTEYAVLDPNPAPLLSRIYHHLNAHIEAYSPRFITGIFAYLLTFASRTYISEVSLSVGFGYDSLSSEPLDMGFNKQPDDLEDADEDEREDSLFELQIDNEIYPSFFPQDLADALPAAKKSLKLLRTAQPDHPLLSKGEGGARAIEWFWTEEPIRAAWHDKSILFERDAKEAEVAHSAGTPVSDQQEIKQQFSMFDLDPGTHLGSSILAAPKASANISHLQFFLENFPATLPSWTPTLPQLTTLVFKPLVEHVATISASLLGIFLAPTSPLHLQSHLTLLRSYLLLTSSSFKSKLSSALFSDSVERESDDQSARSLLRSRAEKRKARDHSSKNVTWAVGLAPSLNERDSWPPGGADLSFLLRTVIVDSLERHARVDPNGGLLEGDNTSAGREHVMEEAEFRLGFAIRDLPVGPGRDKWLNPLCIEALDFLYMDYKAPGPMAVLISPEILSKYQRMFAFALRMMRVEHVIRTIYCITRKRSEPLFPTLASSNALLLHFRFIANSFVHALSEYVFDTAIGANFDAFLARSSPHALSSSTYDEDERLTFSDVYTLAAYHSTVLDDILSSCLLRSSQRGAGDLLRGSLEVVLEFGILAGQLYLQQIEEYEAAPRLEALSIAFRNKMQTLIKVLHAMVEKRTGSMEQPAHRLSKESDVRTAPGGTESLYHLLLRLDIGDWWAGRSVGRWRPTR